MQRTRREDVAGPIRVLFESGPVAGLSDGELLGRFLDRRGEESAEVAFAALVARHGPAVLRVCRGLLRDEHDAQDAFQATFLILARKAGSIRDRESAASWLHGVARRVAACARRSAAARRARERIAAGAIRPSEPDPDRSEVVPAVLEEVADLPEKYRAPLRLCLLDGLTHEEAAGRLGWPVGTVKTRVRHARERLRARLARRGLAPTLGVLAASMASAEASPLPASLARATARAAIRSGMGRGAPSASVDHLVKMGLGSLLMNRCKLAALLLATLGALAVGANGLARTGPTQEPAKTAETPPAAAEKKAEKPDPAKSADDEYAAQANLLDEVKLELVDVDVLRMELEYLKERVGKMFRNVDLARDAARKFRPDPVPDEGYIQRIENQLKEGVAYAEVSLRRVREDYRNKSRELVAKESRIRDSVRKLPGQLQVEALQAIADSKRAGGGMPAANIEDRLSDLERKLDQLINRPGGK